MLYETADRKSQRNVTLFVEERSCQGNEPTKLRDENVGAFAKSFDNKASTQANVHTRSRAALGELQNVETLPHKSFKKPGAPQEPIQADQESTRNLQSLLNERLKDLTQAEINELQTFCQRRKAIRSMLLAGENSSIYMDVDKDTARDAASVSVFAETIFNYLQTEELRCQPLSSTFLSACTEISPRMRYILVNWLVQVHQSYKLQPETLYLCIAIMDRYLQKCGSGITKDLFQLVGITALFIASKFEEMYPPDIGDFSSITDNTYTKRDIRTCEQLILQSLDFYLSIPSPIVFLRRISRALEVNTIDDVWNEKLAYISGYSIEDVRGPLKILAKAVYRQNSPSKYRAIYDKYRLDDLYDKVAALPQLRSAMMEALADLKFDEDGTEVVA
ncbi:unnamed protein product [Dibothriocephalus latus]|uniref:Cyclin-like domain-containing protein n=1 Tax=Dibothriocephalus latus TaxID=60516 RepID=A0A3P7LJY6_DIBLA|nr:unnamed protein product [Dibothriocephalus latus]